MHAYHKVRGATVIFGYVNEEGIEIPVRSLPAEFLDSVKLRNQLRQIEEQYCKEEKEDKSNYHTDFEPGEDKSLRGKARRTLTGDEKRENKKADREERKENKYVLEEGSMKDELERREREDAAGSKKNKQKMTAAAQRRSAAWKKTIKEGLRGDAKRTLIKANDAYDKGDREGGDRLYGWSRTLRHRYVNSAILPGGRDRRHVEVRKDADKAEEKYRDVNESVDSSSLETAIHSYSLPPHEGGDSDWAHHHYVHKVDKHFKKHLELHGCHHLSTKERLFTLAHRHLSERGHISASREQIADEHSSSGLVNHAREKLKNVVYGNLEDHDPKISRIFMHKVNRKIRDDHESRARARGREALNVVSHGGIYE